MKVNIYNQTGQVVGEQELDSSVFGVSPDPSLLHFVVTALTANRRRATAHTKTRAEVRGGGKKPWKQKGTGRARHGSTRSPLWKGGGVTFGPRSDRNYTQKINKKVLRKAMRMCLSQKAGEKQIFILESWGSAITKTKAVKEFLSRLGIPLTKKHAALLVAHEKARDLVRVARNISSVTTVGKENVNIIDLLKYPYLVTTAPVIQHLTNVYGKT